MLFPEKLSKYYKLYNFFVGGRCQNQWCPRWNLGFKKTNWRNNDVSFLWLSTVIFCTVFCISQWYLTHLFCTEKATTTSLKILLNKLTYPSRNCIDMNGRMANWSTSANAYVVNRSFHVVDSMKMASKCKKMKNDLEKRAKLFFFKLNKQTSYARFLVVERATKQQQNVYLGRWKFHEMKTHKTFRLPQS